MKLGKTTNKAEQADKTEQAPEGKGAQVSATDAPTVKEAAPSESKKVAKKDRKDPRRIAQRKSYDAPVEEGDVVYECVLAVREDKWKGEKGDTYEGSGIEDEARLNHLLGRGAIRKR